MMANQLKTTVLLAALTVLIVLIGRMFGGNQGMMIAFIFAMVNIFSQKRKPEHCQRNDKT